MFKQIFAVMNELLDEIINTYPTAVGIKKNQLSHNLSALKAMSDTYIEEWLKFEEKMGKLYNENPVNDKNKDLINLDAEAYEKAQGYFKLMMFEQAALQFNKVLHVQPDFCWARLYLAICYFQLGEQDEAYHQFHLITSLTEDIKIKAICYHHMGWIQAKIQNMDKASEFFGKAYEIDPSISFYSLS